MSNTSNPIPRSIRTAARTGLHEIAARMLPGLVLLAMVKDPPNETEESLIEEVSGDLKHALRRKIGFVVDLLWNVPGWRESLDRDIRAAIAAVSAEEGPTE